MKIYKVLIPMVLAITCIAFRPVDIKKIVADNKSSSIMYAMKHPLHSFDASSKDFKCIAAFDTETRKLSLVAVMVAIKSFNSGNSNRDSHVIENTEALKYPNVTFSAEDISYSGETVIAKGKMVFHGVTKPMIITGIQKVAGNKMTLSGNAEVNMTDFGIKPPSLMGMSTDEIIKLDFMMTFDI